MFLHNCCASFGGDLKRLSFSPGLESIAETCGDDESAQKQCRKIDEMCVSPLMPVYASVLLVLASIISDAPQSGWKCRVSDLRIYACVHVLMYASMQVCM